MINLLKKLYFFNSMNVVDLSPNYKKLYSILVKKFNEVGYFNYGHHDETFCTLRVYETAKELIKRLRQDNFNIHINDQLVLVSCILHDIGKSKVDINVIKNRVDEHSKNYVDEWNSHIIKSVPLAKEVLSAEGHSEQFIENVCYLIGNHNKLLDNLDCSSRSTELKILQDADLIADCCLVDLFRGVSFGAIYKISLYSNLKHIRDRSNRVNESGRLNFDLSKQIVIEKSILYKQILDEVDNLLKTDLIDN